MSDESVLVLNNEEMLTLGVMAIKGFGMMIHEHVQSNSHDVGRLAKCGAVIYKIQTECNKSSDESVARFTAGESDAR